jgi:hypothetical protein
MSPRHVQGVFVLFEIDEPACTGDDVFIVFKDGTTITWGLDAISGNDLTVHGYNPPQTKTISRHLVLEFHPITAWGFKSLDRFLA